jgi:hypothetical protein
VFRKHDEFVKLMAYAMVGISFHCDWMPWTLAQYCAVHPSGFGVITRTPLRKHVMVMLDFCLHVRSSLLTAIGRKIILKRLQPIQAVLRQMACSSITLS